MRAPINEYYTDKEYEFALKEMRRIMERKRALAEAQAAQKAREKVKKEFRLELSKLHLKQRQRLSTSVVKWILLSGVISYKD